MGFYTLVCLYMIKYVIYSEAAQSSLSSDRTVSLLVGALQAALSKIWGEKFCLPRRAWYNFYRRVVLLNASSASSAFLEHFS
jgi:hypothetical protein